MPKKHCLWYRLWIFMCMIALMCNVMVPAYAYSSRIDIQKETSLTVFFQTTDTSCSNAAFRLYHIANVSDTATFILTEEFQNAEIPFQSLTEEQWKTLAQELLDYISKVKTGIMPMAEQKTDEVGKTTFSGLTTGLYLVVGESYSTDNGTYLPVPFLVSLPGKNAENEWEYEREAIVKYMTASVSEPSKLPQTGESWNPIPLLAMSGSLFVIWKISHSRKKKQDRKCHYSYNKI